MAAYAVILAAVLIATSFISAFCDPGGPPPPSPSPPTHTDSQAVRTAQACSPDWAPQVRAAFTTTSIPTSPPVYIPQLIRRQSIDGPVSPSVTTDAALVGYINGDSPGLRPYLRTLDAVLGASLSAQGARIGRPFACCNAAICYASDVCIDDTANAYLRNMNEQQQALLSRSLGYTICTGTNSRCVGYVRMPDPLNDSGATFWFCGPTASLVPVLVTATTTGIPYATTTTPLTSFGENGSVTRSSKFASTTNTVDQDGGRSDENDSTPKTTNQGGGNGGKTDSSSNNAEEGDGAKGGGLSKEAKIGVITGVVGAVAAVLAVLFAYLQWRK